MIGSGLRDLASPASRPAATAVDAGEELALVVTTDRTSNGPHLVYPSPSGARGDAGDRGLGDGQLRPRPLGGQADDRHRRAGRRPGGHHPRGMRRRHPAPLRAVPGGARRGPRVPAWMDGAGRVAPPPWRPGGGRRRRRGLPDHGRGAGQAGAARPARGRHLRVADAPGRRHRRAGGTSEGRARELAPVAGSCGCSGRGWRGSARPRCPRRRSRRPRRRCTPPGWASPTCDAVGHAQPVRRQRRLLHPPDRLPAGAHEHLRLQPRSTAIPRADRRPWHHRADPDAVRRGGGIGLFTGCAAGDTGAAVVVRVED